MIQYISCPVCDSSNISPCFCTKDNTVSKEMFEVWQCGACSLRFTQNIPEETAIGKYYQSEAYVSHSNTSKGFINKLYHKVSVRTLVQKRKLIEKFTEKAAGKCLDIGAGTGAFLQEMQSNGWQATGLEPDEKSRANAAEIYKVNLLPAEHLSRLVDASFDAISMWHVLEHVHSLHHYVDEIKRLLKKDGKAFIAVPNYTSYDAKKYGADWAAYDVPRHLYHFSPASMKWLMEKHGLKVISMQPMWFDSFYVSMLSEKNKNGRPGLLQALSTGIKSNMKAAKNVEVCSSVIYVIAKAL